MRYVNVLVLPLAVIFCALLAAVSQVHAADTAAAATDSAKIGGLINQLGSEEYSQRESATDELTRIGLPAYAALEAAAVHPDREVRYRSKRILGLIRELDMQRRLDAFLSGTELEAEYVLPGWNRFKKTYGDKDVSRQLFVEMQRADHELMRALEDSPRSAADVVTQRMTREQQAFGAQTNLSLGQVLGMLFVASQDDVELQPQTMSSVFNYCQQQALRDVMSNTAKKEIPRKMVGTLIERSEDWASYQAMILAITYDMDEGMTPALKILGNPAKRMPHMAQYALMVIAQRGNESHLPMIEKLFDDRSVISRMQEGNNVFDLQLRDAALATAVMLTKQDLKKYFEPREGHDLKDPQQVLLNARLIGFQSDEARAEVFKKWAEYKATAGKAPQQN